MQTQYLSGSAEPETIAYSLRTDLLEIHLNNGRDECWVEVKFGGRNPETSEKVNFPEPDCV
jgi:hypothetical protein